MVGDNLWAFVVLGGFVILGAAIAYAMMRNRVSPEREARTEEATARLYDEEQPAADETPRQG
jgi:hypothetical protein